jgi:hypothetical protein
MAVWTMRRSARIELRDSESLEVGDCPMAVLLMEPVLLVVVLDEHVRGQS